MRPTWRSRSSRWVLAAALLLAACGPRSPRSPLAPLDRAAEAVRDGSRDPEVLALAAWHAHLVRGDGPEAERLLAPALEEARPPWALLLEAELAARAEDPRREAAALLDLLEAGVAPFDRLAARRLARLGGVSRSLDASLLHRLATHLEEARPRGEVASILRDLLIELESRSAPEDALARAREAGRVSAFRLVGPLHPHAYLDFGRSAPQLEAGPIPEGEGRLLETPAGHLSLAPLAAEGDVFYALAVAEAPRRGRHLVRVRSDATTSFTLFLDGQEIFGRRGFGMPMARELVAEVELTEGEHLLALRIGRGRGRGGLTVEIAPKDGAPASLAFRAAEPGDRARQGGTRRLEILPGEARATADELAPEAGILAAWVGADLAFENEVEAARGFLEALFFELPASPALHARRARFWLLDPGLPGQLARDRAISDLTRALEDPDDVAARVRLAALHRREGRYEEAEAAIEELGAVAAAIESARIARDRGFDALFGVRAREVAERAPDRCAALELAHAAALRERDAAARRSLVERLETCPGGLRKRLSAERDAGNVAAARRIAEHLALFAPSSVEVGLLRAEVEQAAGAPAQAAAIVAELEGQWPELASLPRARAQYLAAAGEEAGAREARLRALELDGSDLALLRVEAFERRRGILEEHDPDAREAIRAFEASGKVYDAPGVILIDFVGVQVNADGSLIERTHMLAKILDKRGIDLLGEARIPDEAEILEVRTIKADGRVLEPEDIAVKESISFPGLEVGDYVEYQYLVGRGRRSVALPGWAGPRFFFASRDLPMVESIYAVRVEKSLGIEVDPHQSPPRGEIRDEGTHLLFLARGQDLPAYIAEPRAVPMQEVVPWVQVGSGAGERAYACHLADRLIGASWRDGSVERWAREAVRGAETPRERIEKLWDRLMEEIEGQGSFEAPATHVLSRGRGNRTVLLKAALDSLGIENAWVALGTFERSPRPHRFPHPSRLRKLVLVARPEPTSGWLWLDPSVRYAPLGAVSSEARGMQGYVLGQGRGESACVPTTSPLEAEDERLMHYRLEVEENGDIEGRVVERFRGFEAAGAREALERLDEDRLRQVVEASLAREFAGAELIDVERSFDAEGVSISYAFRLPSGLRPIGGNRMALDLEFLRMRLAPRYLTGAERKSSLFLPKDERLVMEAEIVLPSGWAPIEAPRAALEASDFGSFRRSVGAKNENLVVRDVLEIRRGRVLPHAYGAFAAWIGAIDRAQIDDLAIEGASGEEPEGDLGVEVEPAVGAGDAAPVPQE